MMKKVLFLAVCCILMTGLTTSCGGSSPDNVVNEFMEFLKNKDFNGMLQMQDEELFKKKKAELDPQEFERMLEIGKNEIFSHFESGIKSYDIVSREVDEKAEVGLFYANIILENGDEIKQAISVVKKNGKWIPGLCFSNYEHVFTLDEVKETVQEMYQR